MTGSFSRLSQMLPSVQGITESITDDFRNRRSVLIMIPGTMRPGYVWPMLRAHTYSKGFYCVEAYASDLPEERPIADGLCTALRVAWNSAVRPMSAEHFIRHSGELPDIIYFDEFDELPSKRKFELLEFLAQWADASHICADQGGKPSSLCIVTSSPEIVGNLPFTDTHLSVHWWFGVPSSLEVKLLCRILSNNRSTSSELWVESVLPAIVGADLGMADYIWPEYDPRNEGLLKKISGYSEMRQWDLEYLRDSGIEDYDEHLEFHNGNPSIFNSGILRNLWIKGLIYWTPEYGLQINTAVLLLLGKEKEVQHRVWRGQVEHLLPLLDRIRLALCEKLTIIYGPSWPYQWEKPKYEEDYEAVVKDPLSCELGYLQYLLYKCPNMRRERNLLPLVNQAKSVRNDLAHYRPVEYAEYEKLINEASIISNGRL